MLIQNTIKFNMITINEIAIILFITIVSSALSFYYLPKIMLFSLKLHLLDNICSRKIHTCTASRLGGICFLPIVFITSLITIAYLNIYGLGALKILIPNSLLVELSSLVIIYLIGTYDDIIGIRYHKKFIFQFIVASLIITSGTYINEFHGLLGIETIPKIIKALSTFILIVLITNALNLIDGLDGLCASISILAFTIYGLIFFIIDDTLNGLICFSAIGVLISFFYFNVFGIKKQFKSKIFMGDSGSLFLGFLLSIMTIKIWNAHINNPILISNKYYHIAAIVAIFIPCIDVARVILCRLKNKKHIFSPDKNHFHHKLLKLGLNSKQILTTILILNCLYFILDFSLTLYANINIIFGINIIIWVILNILISKKIIKNKK